MTCTDDAIDSYDKLFERMGPLRDAIGFVDLPSAKLRLDIGSYRGVRINLRHLNFQKKLVKALKINALLCGERTCGARAFVCAIKKQKRLKILR